jgi:DNA polymerase-3 subunit alpha
MYFVFDVETTGLPKNYKAGYEDTENWPRMVEIAWKVLDKDLKIIKQENYIIKPDGFTIPQEAIDIHGIDNEQALSEGVSITIALHALYMDLGDCVYLVGHNVHFDKRIVGCEMFRCGLLIDLEFFKGLKQICTMNSSISTVGLKQANSNKAKYPNLNELHKFLFNKDIEDSHQAENDVRATVDCFIELVKLNKIKALAVV